MTSIPTGFFLKMRLKKNRCEKFFNPNDELKEFSSGNDGFTLTEGDWGDYYGSRVEVWFQPDNSNEPERKLIEKNYIIQGN